MNRVTVSKKNLLTIKLIVTQKNLIKCQNLLTFVNDRVKTPTFIIDPTKVTIGLEVRRTEEFILPTELAETEKPTIMYYFLLFVSKCWHECKPYFLYGKC